MASTDISNFIQVQREQFVAVCSDPQIQFEREAYFALQILQGNDYLSKVAKGNQDSLKNAIINVAAIGISLNPAKKLAYLVPRDQKVCLDISYMGLMHIAQQTGAIYWAQSSIVMASDVFELQGLDKAPVHKFNPFSKDRGEIIGVYVTVKTGEGDYLTHTMTIDAVHDIRNRSAAWKSFVEKKTKCPWVTDTEEMIKKTCVKQGSKYWPRRDRLDHAIHYLNTEAGEGLVDLEPEPSITEDQCAGLETELLNVGGDKAAFLQYFKVASLKDLPSSQHKKAMDMIMAKRKKQETKQEREPGEDG